MEGAVYILIGIAIAAIFGFAALLLWLAWSLNKGVNELRKLMVEVAKATASYEALNGAIPTFKKISEQGDQLVAGMSSLNLSVKKLLIMIFRRPPEGVSTAVPSPGEQEKVDSKIFEQSEEEYAEQEAREQLRQQGIYPQSETAAVQPPT